jgi:hypothetical protein
LNKLPFAYIDENRADNRERIDPGVPVEIVVFGGDECLCHPWRNLIELDQLLIALTVYGAHGAIVAVVNLQALPDYRDSWAVQTGRLQCD